MEWRCIQCQKKPGKKIAVKLTKNPKQKIFHHTCKKSPKGFYTAEKDDTPYLAIGKACVYQAIAKNEKLHPDTVQREVWKVAGGGVNLDDESTMILALNTYGYGNLRVLGEYESPEHAFKKDSEGTKYFMLYYRKGVLEETGNPKKFIKWLSGNPEGLDGHAMPGSKGKSQVVYSDPQGNLSGCLGELGGRKKFVWSK